MRNELTEPTLWLQIRSKRRNYAFELLLGNERAIVVGSLLRADVRIDEPGIAPVHFHFERDGYLVHLVPAYGADLRVEGAPINAPFAIRQQALIQFREHRLHVTVLEHPPGSSTASADAPPDHSTPDEALGGYADRTVIAVKPLDEAQPCELPAHSSQDVSPILLGHVLAPRPHATLAGAPLAPCTPCGTVAVSEARSLSEARCFTPDARRAASSPSVRPVRPRKRSSLVLLLLVIGTVVATLAAWSRGLLFMLR